MVDVFAVGGDPGIRYEAGFEPEMAAVASPPYPHGRVRPAIWVN